MSFLGALLLLATLQAPDRIAWMRPDAFHLTVGMPRAAAVEALRAWGPKPGVNADEVVVDFNGERAVTMQFRRDRLVSLRFELILVIPEVRRAFDEARSLLASGHGEPRRTGKSVVVYDNTLPNILLVAADDPQSEHGKKGLGTVVVRYYDPR